MNCEKCQKEMKRRLATPEKPYHYTLSGLKGLRLIGIEVFHCPGCVRESPIIPKIGQLHEAVARTLLKKEGLLTGDELRFLRKHMGVPSQALAELLGVDPSHLSRFENGAYENLGAPTDKLARATLAASGGGMEAREVLLRRAEALARRRQWKQTFAMERNHWRAVQERQAA